MKKLLAIFSLLFLCAAASRLALAVTQAAQTTDKPASPQECMLTPEDYAVLFSFAARSRKTGGS
jgi:hypothetical protein